MKRAWSPKTQATVRGQKPHKRKCGGGEKSGGTRSQTKPYKPALPNKGGGARRGNDLWGGVKTTRGGERPLGLGGLAKKTHLASVQRAIRGRR